MPAISTDLAHQLSLRLTLSHLFTGLGLAFLYYLLKFLYGIFLRPRFSSVRHLPGPKSEHWLWGNLAKIFDGEPGKAHQEMIGTYGPIVKYTGFAGADRLLIADPKAINHILLNAYAFPKPDDLRGEIKFILGNGVLFAEGEAHRRQRRIMQPAFNAAHNKELLPIFLDNATKMRDKWAALLASGSDDMGTIRTPQDRLTSGTAEKGSVTINVAKWISRCTLDIIGQAGFNYTFGSLDNADNRLAKAFASLFADGGTHTMGIGRAIAFVIMRFFPFALRLPTKRLRSVTRAFSTMSEESKIIYQQRRAEVEQYGEKSGSKDVMTLLIRANLAESNPKNQMSEQEVMGQMTTLMLAGHETTSVATTWCLYFLATHKEAQTKLRDEIRKAKQELGGSDFTADQLEALPYLDAVTRETFRVLPPVMGTIRTAAEDAVVPLSQPITEKNGKQLDSITIPKGLALFLSIAHVNFGSSLYGADAEEFKPERWQGGLPKAIQDNVIAASPYSPLLTFLGGPRACIGWRFAVLEFKAIVSTLIEGLDFGYELDEPPRKKTDLVCRAYIKGFEKEGSQLPLRVRSVESL